MAIARPVAATIRRRGWRSTRRQMGMTWDQIPPVNRWRRVREALGSMSMHLYHLVRPIAKSRRIDTRDLTK